MGMSVQGLEPHMSSHRPIGPILWEITAFISKQNTHILCQPTLTNQGICDLDGIPIVQGLEPHMSSHRPIGPILWEITAFISKQNTHILCQPTLTNQGICDLDDIPISKSLISTPHPANYWQKTVHSGGTTQVMGWADKACIGWHAYLVLHVTWLMRVAVGVASSLLKILRKLTLGGILVAQ